MVSPSYRINYRNSWICIAPDEEAYVITALGPHSRVCRIELDMTGSHLEMIGRAAMQKPFPALTHLYIGTAEDQKTLVLPGGFLGGSVPCLKKVTYFEVSFWGLPTLLSSARDPVELRLYNARYVSAQVIVTGVAVLPRLATFRLVSTPFKSLRLPYHGSSFVLSRRSN